MKSIYLAQTNFRFGENIFLPYSVGRLWSYAKSTGAMDGYQLGTFADGRPYSGFIFLREDPEHLARQLVNPWAVFISHYIWNAEWNKRFSAAVKAAHPKCKIVAGGPEIPKREEEAARECAHFDHLVHGEGELWFADFLRRGGLTLSWHHLPERVSDLAELASPYLDGTFDELMRLSYTFQPVFETNRGCVFRCSFCQWGTDEFQKFQSFSKDMILEEIDWFSRNKLEFIYNADANFGMRREDEDYANRLCELKRTTGYPKQFRAAYSKKTNERVFSIGRKFTEHGMCKGVTLSMQSMDEGTLEAVKRGNIPITDFADKVKRYREAGVPTYTEIILGLPGETAHSFEQGLNTIIDAGQHDGINIYPCMLLKNSEMADPDYRREYGLRTVRLPMILNHASAEDAAIAEQYDLVVETSTMPYNDWLNSFLTGWKIQIGHCLGLLRPVAMRIKNESPGSPWTEIYHNLFASSSALWAEYVRTLQMIHEVVQGERLGWDSAVEGTGDILWPLEEASFLRLVRNYEQVMDELAKALHFHDWHNVADESAAFINLDEAKANFENYARQRVWYSRKGGVKQKEVA